MNTNKKRPSQWCAGQSGNPAGRPRGVGEVTKLRNAIADRLPEIVEVIINKALEGDSQAARLLLDRALPALRPTDNTVQIELPGEGLVAKSFAILNATSAGELTPQQAGALMSCLTQITKVKETEELNQRLQTIQHLLEIHCAK